MRVISKYFLCFFIAGCAGNAQDKKLLPEEAPVIKTVPAVSVKRHYSGAVTNGMKGDSIFFDISADGKKLENLMFKGYWRCSGKLEQTTVGPDGSFSIVNGKVSGHLSEPPNGGSTAWRFELDANIKPGSATGTFRMNINNQGCDTYKLNWSAVSKTK